MSTGVRRRITGVAAFAVTALLAMTACSSSHSGGGGGGGTESAGKKDLGTIKVILGAANSLAYIAAEHGQEVGAWDGTGLKVEVTTGTSATATQALATGAADIEINAGTNSAIAIAQGLNAKIVAANDLPSSHFMFVSNKYIQKHDVKGMQDLGHATFAVSSPGSAGDYATRRLAEHFHWNKSDYKIVSLGDIKAIEAAVKRGDVDAFSFGVPTPFLLEADGTGKALAPMKDYMPEDANSVFLATDKVLSERPEAVKAFFDGYFKAVKIYQNQPQKAIDIMTGQWKIAPDAAKKSADFLLPLLSTDGVIPSKNLTALEDASQFVNKDVKVDAAKIYQYWKDAG